MKYVMLVTALAAAPVYGWGREGHRIIGEIAFAELKPRARAEVVRLISLDPQYERFNEACNWADHIRRDPNWRWASPLHYTNIEGAIGESVDEAKTFDRLRDCDVKIDCPDGTPCPNYACVVDAIDYYAGLLGDPLAGDDEELIALKFVGHFVGDLHQPLHAGYRRDRGGNDRRVTYFNQPTNLHKVLDFMMIRREESDWLKFATDLHADITDQQRQKCAESLDPADWATESHALCPAIYAALPEDGRVDDAYQSKMMPLVKKQLQAGGVRLGALLNQILAQEE